MAGVVGAVAEGDPEPIPRDVDRTVGRSLEEGLVALERLNAAGAGIEGVPDAGSLSIRRTPKLVARWVCGHPSFVSYR